MHNLVADPTGYRFMLARAQHSAFGWECQGIYQGAAPPDEWQFPTGVRVDRVLALSEPITESQHQQLGRAPQRRARGEQVRTLSESQALALDMPDHDFWIIDDEYVVIVQYREHECIGATATTDPELIAQYRQCRDLVCSRAVALLPQQRCG